MRDQNLAIHPGIIGIGTLKARNVTQRHSRNLSKHQNIFREQKDFSEFCENNRYYYVIIFEILSILKFWEEQKGQMKTMGAFDRHAAEVVFYIQSAV